MARKRRTGGIAIERLFDEEAERRLIESATVDRPAPTSNARPPSEPAPPVQAAQRKQTARPETSTRVQDGEPAMGAWYGRLSVEKKGLSAGSWEENQAKLRDEMFRRYPHVTPTETYLDNGVSGAAINDLRERERCTEAAKKGDFKVLFCEDVDRLGRNFIDVSVWAARMMDHGIRIVTVRYGEPETMLFRFLAIFAAHEREKMSIRVRETRPCHIATGRVLGICPYGYETDENDKLIVYEPEARVVRFIFHLYGTTFVGADQICRILEELKIRAPKGGETWYATQLLGTNIHYEDGPERMQGILCRSAYIGDRVTSIVSTKRGSDGKITVRYRPKAEQAHNDCPAIVTHEIYFLVQKRLRSLNFGRHTTRHLLARLMRCGVCNGPMVLSGATVTTTGPWGVARRVRCRASLEGKCSHQTSYDLAALQMGVMRILHDPLHDERLVAHYNAAAAEARAEPLGDPIALKSDLAEIERVLGNLVKDKAKSDGLDDVYDDAIGSAKAERFEIQQSIDRYERARMDAVKIDVHDARKAVAYFIDNDIPQDLTSLSDKHLIEAVQRFRELFVQISISPTPGRRAFFAYRCETVFGEHVGAALVRFQKVNAVQASVIDRLRDAPEGMRLRDLATSGADGPSNKDAVLSLCKYGILDKVDGGDGRHRYRLSRKPPPVGPLRFVRFEIRRRGSRTVEHDYAFLSPSRPSSAGAGSWSEDLIAA